LVRVSPLPSLGERIEICSRRSRIVGHFGVEGRTVQLDGRKVNGTFAKQSNVRQ
jgi:hypothetical protein